MVIFKTAMVIASWFTAFYLSHKTSKALVGKVNKYVNWAIFAVVFYGVHYGAVYLTAFNDTRMYGGVFFWAVLWGLVTHAIVSHHYDHSLSAPRAYFVDFKTQFLRCYVVVLWGVLVALTFWLFTISLPNYLQVIRSI